jgi:hypothetical protein
MRKKPNKGRTDVDVKKRIIWKRWDAKSYRRNYCNLYHNNIEHLPFVHVLGNLSSNEGNSKFPKNLTFFDFVHWYNDTITYMAPRWQCPHIFIYSYICREACQGSDNLTRLDTVVLWLMQNFIISIIYGRKHVYLLPFASCKPYS